MSDCARARAELEEYVHHELTSEDAADIRAHLERCADCNQEALVAVALTKALQGSCRERAPEELRARILESLRSQQKH